MASHPVQEIAGGLLALEQLLGSSFGPLGADKLVVDDMQQTVSTTASADMLHVLHPEHPMLTMVQRSAQEFLSQHGDGGKRMLLMLSAGLRAALLEVPHAQHAQLAVPRMAHLAHALAALQGYAEEVAAGVANAQAHAVDMYLVPPADQQKVHSQQPLPPSATGGTRRTSPSSADRLSTVVRAVVHTGMGNRAGRAAVKVLSRRLTELVVTTGSITGSTAAQTAGLSTTAPEVAAALSQLGQTVQGNTSWLVPCPGLPVASSRVIHGQMLHASFAAPLPSNWRLGMALPFIVLQCPLDPGAVAEVPGQSGTAQLHVSSQEQYKQLAARRIALIKLSLVEAAARGVRLIISTQRVSELEVWAAKEAGIGLIPLVDEAEAQALCGACAILPVTSSSAASIRSASVGVIVRVEQVVMGPTGRRGLVLGLASCNTSQTLLVAAPSEGLAKHYARVVRAAASLLAVSVEARGPHEATSMAHGCKPAPQHVNKLSELPMRLLPGGAAFEAALAAVIEHHIHHAHMTTVLNLNTAAGASTGTDCCPTASCPEGDVQPMLDQTAGQPHSWLAAIDATVYERLHRQPSSALLPALRVLHGMAVAVPSALASTGGISTTRPTDHNGSNMPLVHRLHGCHTAALRQPVPSTQGLIVPDEAAWRKAWRLHQCPAVQQYADGTIMQVGEPCLHGVLQPAGHALAVWSAAISLLVQLLRVDQVVSARRLGGGGALVLQSRPVSVGMRSGGRRREDTHDGCCSDREGHGSD